MAPAAPTQSLARIALRMTCPVIVYAYLIWLAFRTNNIKGVVGLLGIALFLGLSYWSIMATHRACLAACGNDPARIDQLVGQELALTKRLGGIFCTVVAAVGLAFVFSETNPFLQIACPVMVSGQAAIFVATYRLRKKFKAL